MATIEIRHVPGECPHPDREGSHEEYRRADGSTVCKACGMDSNGGGVPKRKCCGTTSWEDHKVNCISNRMRDRAWVPDGKPRELEGVYRRPCVPDELRTEMLDFLADGRVLRKHEDIALNSWMIGRNTVPRITSISVEGSLTIHGPVTHDNLAFAAALKRVEELEAALQASQEEVFLWHSGEGALRCKAGGCKFCAPCLERGRKRSG